MEAITRIAQIAQPMIVFTVFLLQDGDCEASSNYGAMGQGAIEGFLQLPAPRLENRARRCAVTLADRVSAGATQGLAALVCDAEGAIPGRIKASL